MTATTRVQMVGGGQMGLALAKGMIDAGWGTAEEIRIIEIDAGRAEQLATLVPGAVIADQLVEGVDTVLAVKPHLITTVAASLPTPGRVMSIAAGITTAAIEAVVPDRTPVLRVMPNTPALLGHGASGLAPGAAANDDDLVWASDLLASVGSVAVVTEAQLDAVTGLSGSGPAYYFLIAEAMIDAGVAAGLPRATAKLLAHQTMAGAAAMLMESDKPASELRGDVTTPKGTTAAGLRVLEQRGVRGALIDAVAAAADRSVELGRS